MIFSFSIGHATELRTFCVIERNADRGSEVDLSGLSDISDVQEWLNRSFFDVASALVRDGRADVVVVSRNPAVVFDDFLCERIHHSLKAITDVTDKWALISGAGLGHRGERQCVYYSSSEPCLPFGRYIRPIVDSLPDFYILNAEFLRHFLELAPSPDLSFIETAFILSGYYQRYISFYMPMLSVAINGPYLSRELRRSPELWPLLDKLGRSGEIMTFSGNALKRHGMESKIDYSKTDFSDQYSEVIRHYSPAVSISIITRTRFERPHLLDRLLTSISRARPKEGSLEIILSTDVDKELAEPEFGRVVRKFPNVNLRLCVNEAVGHSRIDNLVGGFKFAKNDYVWIVDDDDYIDLFAFDNISDALFLGAKPVIISSTQAHVEKWERTESEFPVLSASRPGTYWPPSGWKSMFGGVNQLPICSVLVPRQTILSVVSKFTFRFDLSEDYTLFLLLLCSPDLPEIYELSDVLTHVSIREEGQNSVTVSDRTNWTRDIAGFLGDLFVASSEGRGGNWSAIAAAASPREPTGASELTGLRSEIDLLQRQLVSLTQQNDYLYRLIEEEK